MRRTREEPREVHLKPLPEDDVDEAVDLWRAIGHLPRRQAEAVVLYYVLDLPVADVAEVMGCRDGTAKTHLDRGRQRVARLLGPTDANAEDG